jgi:hypothetical protein
LPTPWASPSPQLARPGDAAAADASIGVNHSSLFIEYYGSNLGGFGSSDVMQVGTNTFVFGLMLEI